MYNVPRKKDQFKLLNAIDEIHTDYPNYGTRRIVVELKKRF